MIEHIDIDKVISGFASKKFRSICFV